MGCDLKDKWIRKIVYISQVTHPKTRTFSRHIDLIKYLILSQNTHKI